MRIDGVKLVPGGVMLRMAPREAAKLAALAPGDYDLAPEKKRRSLDANAYAWALIDKLAAVMCLPPVEVYRAASRNLGGVSVILCLTQEAAPEFRRKWEGKGRGWQTETQPSKLPGCVTVTAWYGSSTYDTRQMSRLIDSLVQDCRALGIETMPEDRVAALLESWG